MKITNILLAATALVAVAGCSKKRPQTLPPAPGAAVIDNTGGVDGANGGDQEGNGSGRTGPGSNADFVRSVQSNTINFGLDQYDIDPTARAILDSQVEWLARFPAVRVTVEGHADERGTREYNLALGDRRANAAKNYLVARGVDAGRIRTISYGKERPVALGSDEGSWAQNRRAVTVVLD
jgi:peptidoglycan-associated lipoprotein